MQLLEKRSDVFCSTRFKDEFGYTVLCMLKVFDDRLCLACL